MRNVDLRRVLVFLVLTFALSWAVLWLIATMIGHRAYVELGVSPVGMLIPAFVAIALRMFVLRDSPLHVSRSHGRLRWVFGGFLVLTIVYGAFTFVGIKAPISPAVFQGICGLLMTLWTLLVLFIAPQTDAEERGRLGMQLGDAGVGVKLVVGVVAFFALQAGLNLLLGLGRVQGYGERVYGVAVPEDIYPVALLVALGLALTGIPLSGLAAVFGEEYGRRGFLQDELLPLGARRAAVLIGLVWGVWHIPVFLSGIHTYPATGAGLALGLVFFVLWGIIQSYAVLKTGGIWVAAFLHGVVNSVYAYTIGYVVCVPMTPCSRSASGWEDLRA